MSVFGLLSIVLLVVFSIMFKNWGDKRQDFALRDMENLSEQLITGGLKTLPDTSGVKSDRQPASVMDQLRIPDLGSEGKIGKDPWGNAFHYKVLKSEKVGYVVVISGGPDGLIQTDSSEIHSGPNGHILGARFHSDDIGYVKQIR